MIKQFLRDVDWGEVDYLIVDTPPGTSDEHLSAVQYLAAAHIDGAVIITTPQVSQGPPPRRVSLSHSPRPWALQHALTGIRRNLMFIFGPATVSGQGGIRWLGQGWGPRAPGPRMALERRRICR